MHTHTQIYTVASKSVSMILKLAQIRSYHQSLITYCHITNTIRKLNQSSICILNLVLFDQILIE